MQIVEIKNKRVLDILEDVRYTYTEKYNIKEICTIDDAYAERGDWYTSDKFRDVIIKSGEKHDGAAVSAYAYFLKPSMTKWSVPYDLHEQYRQDWLSIDERMKVELGLQSGALLLYYPPKGYIEWHNNANAAAYNVIFTYNAEGDGYFKYYDLKTKQNVVIPDKKGWSLKMGYFGSYDEPDKLVYHCAKTNCDRITMSYVLGSKPEFWEDCIDYISEE